MVHPRSILLPISCEALSDCCLLCIISSVKGGRTNGGDGGGVTSVAGVVLLPKESGLDSGDKFGRLAATELVAIK